MNSTDAVEIIKQSIDIANARSITLPFVDVTNENAVFQFISKLWRWRYSDNHENHSRIRELISMIPDDVVAATVEYANAETKYFEAVVGNAP